ncbi:CGNR zinc finger domain-containing protein [Nocardiopsis potens]|uniref:CGNR zinc finger domain-containing protein n=1 Tax=Nocardiopsis potens TaxID=1246458 RepID=UPI0004759E75|nr:CGNR zinc finger domain-containing protein [Nocardiopsis potens]
MSSTATGFVMNPPDGASYLFDPGSLCFELLTTGGPGEFARWESLHEPGDLAAWLAKSRLRLDPDQVRVSSEELTAARRVRDAIMRMAQAVLRGDPLGAEDVAEVNRAAAAPPLAPSITPGGARAWALPADASQALSTVARDAVELFTGRFADRIRECAGQRCRLVFVDTSRPGRRRWCAMERCGNRSKVRALRTRRASEEPGGPGERGGER